MLKIKAAAKINLSLDIVGVRNDGYHLLNTVMQSVSLFDEISLELTNGDIIVTSSNNTLGNENDICYRAARSFLERVNRKSGVKIHVDKNIPLSAGLGGGSTDAAAVLLGINELFGNPLNFEILSELALSLGADVPYFLYGGTVLVSGIGEVCTPLSDFPDCYIVLAKKENKKSTKYMYDLIDKSDVKIHSDTLSVVTGINSANINAISKQLKNSFAVAWDDSEIKSIASEFNPLTLSLSGSGPTYFILFSEKASANGCTEHLKEKGYEAYITQPTKKAIIFE